jgi:hypothetical protein
MAPEALRSREYSEATDAFSFGVLLWYAYHNMPCVALTVLFADHTTTTVVFINNDREMVERKRPWAGMEAVQIVTAVTSNTRLKIPKDCDPVFQRLMKMCWRQNPAQRYGYMSAPTVE